MKNTYIIGMLVEDQSGVMSRVSGLFARRGFNINTITVGKTNAKGISKMVFSIYADEKTLEQVIKQVNKLVSVIKISELKEDESIARELALIKVDVKNDNAKNELFHYSEIYKVKISDITKKSIVFEIVGSSAKIDSFIDNVKKFGIKEISRTGITAIPRGNKITGDRN